MTKIITLIMFGLLVLNTQIVFAKNKDTIAQPSNTQNYSYEYDENFNFDENSYNISDEQLQDAKELEKIDDSSNFDDKVINSSHFSSGTATRTWIPINKIK